MDILDQPIRSFICRGTLIPNGKLGVRVCNAMINGFHPSSNPWGDRVSITFVRELYDLNEVDLLRCKNFGHRSLMELKCFLKFHNLPELKRQNNIPGKTAKEYHILINGKITLKNKHTFRYLIEMCERQNISFSLE